MSELADVAAERALLAGLCQYGQDANIDTADIVTTDTLTLDSNQIIYKCITHVLKASEKADIASIIAAASELGFYDRVKEKSEIEYIRSLFNFPIHKENVRTHAKKLAKLQIARRLQIELKKVFTSINNVTGSESVAEILGLAQRPIMDFGNSLGEDENVMSIVGSDLAEYLLHLKDNPNKPMGISSGFTRYDTAIGGGFRRKTISLIGARMKQGKSIFAENVAMHVAGRLNIPVLMLDTEMAIRDHQHRLLAYNTKIPLDTIEGSKFWGNPILEEKINRAVTKIEALPYTYACVAGKSFPEILSIAHRWLCKDVGETLGVRNDCLVIYDYFKLMTSEDLTKNMQEFQVLGFQISNMHNFCVKYDFPVLSYVQLNRDGITGESTDVVSQSDRLLWLCNNFSIFKSKTTEEIVDDGEEWGNKKLIPLVCRNGAGISEGNYINMSMQGQYAMLEELRLKSEAAQQAKESSGFEVEDDEEAPFDE